MNSSCSRITENSALANCVIDVFVCTVNLTQSRSDSASEMSTVRKPSPSVCEQMLLVWEALRGFEIPGVGAKFREEGHYVPGRRRSWLRRK